MTVLRGSRALRRARIKKWPGYSRYLQSRRKIVRDVTMAFDDVARAAGFSPGVGGKFQLPATQATADLLADTASRLLGEWLPGDPVVRLTLTGAGPVWGYLAIAHALHGRVTRLVYAAPNAPEIVIWHHGS